MSMSIEQCRAARALLGWTAADLAEAGKLGAATVRRFESGDTVQDGSVTAMRSALEAAGVRFISAGDRVGTGGAGVRMAN